jgi:hypothetical protein
MKTEKEIIELNFQYQYLRIDELKRKIKSLEKSIKYLGDILDDENTWDEIDEYHNFLKTELYNLVNKVK